MTRILFVDDQPKVLNGLERMLRRFRKIWEMDFVTTGRDALELMSQRSFDVIVSDMRMPGMDGAELLTKVRDLHPNTVRIVLSGQAEVSRVLRVIRTAHQYLSKPCDAETLRETVVRACDLRDRLTNEALKSVVSKIDAVPSTPITFSQFFAEMQGNHLDIARLGQLMSKDVGMTAKILQLVSSSFFGPPQRLTTIAQGTSLLGAELIAQLASQGAFCELRSNALDGFSIYELNSHSQAIAETAKQITEIEGKDEQVQGDCYLAGMLHNVGEILLATCFPDRYAIVMSLMQKHSISKDRAEMEVFGTNNAEVGSYLLGLWGLPQPIVEAVGFHFSPIECGHKEFCPLMAVHAANLIEQQSNEYGNSLDSNYLHEAGYTDQSLGWNNAMLQSQGGRHDRTTIVC